MRLKPGVPVLLREPGHVQVGLVDPMIVTNASREEQVFLASLEGRRVALSQMEWDRYRRLIDALDRCGLLEPAQSPTTYSGIIRIHGVDPLTSWLAIGLALAGIGELSVVDPRLATPFDRISGFPGIGDDAALLKVLRDADPSLRVVTPDEDARLEVLRSHGASDLALARILTSRDIPHLEIVTDEAGITVGPLIVPGTTPCETCLGIERAESDPWWPRLALQLGDPRRNAGLIVPTPAALLAAGLALRDILAFLDGVEPSSIQWRVPFDTLVPESRTRLPHPDCGCGADPASARALGLSLASNP